MASPRGAGAPDSKASMFHPGDIVRAKYEEGQWYLATVEHANADGTFTIGWFDGDITNRVRRASELEAAGPPGSAPLGQDACPRDEHIKGEPTKGEDHEEGSRPPEGARHARGQGRAQPGQGFLRAARLRGRGAASGVEVPPSAAELSTPEDASTAAPPEEAPEPMAPLERLAQDAPTEPPLAAPPLRPGARVRLAGLQSHPEMNGLPGTVVEARGDRWQIHVDGIGNRLLQVKNLERVEQAPQELDPWADDLRAGDVVQLAGMRKDPRLEGHVGVLVEEQEDGRWLVELEGEQAVALGAEHLARLEVDDDDEYGFEWDKDWEPAPCCLALAGGAGGEMNWDPHRSCLQFNVKLGDDSRDLPEQFQIFMNGDPAQQLYPDRERANPHDGGKVRGPDDRGAGRFWTIGDHPLDEAAAGAAYEVRLFIGRHGRGVKVDWVRVGETPFGAVEAKSSVRKSNGTGNSQEPAPHRLPPNRGSLQMLLQSARPTWSWSTLEAVVEKLAKIEIRSGLALLLELEARKEDPADESINRKLRAAGEKAFTADTLSALASRAEFLESEIRWRENQPLKEVDLDQFRSDTRGGAAPALEPEDIPEQRFRVVNFWAFVREAPSLQAPILCRKDVGDLVGARQQTFDGFVKLSGEPGWLLRDLGGEHGLGRVLEPLEPELPLTFSVRAEGRGPQRFSVLRHGTGIVRAHPSEAAPIVGFRSQGDAVLIIAQTFHGWLRLDPEETTKGGWLPAREPESGEPVVRCRVLEERQERWQKLQHIREAIASLDGPAPDLEEVRGALEGAREAGLSKEERRAAEAALGRLLRERAERAAEAQVEEARRELSFLVESAAASVDELEAALARAAGAGLRREELRPAEALLAAARAREREELRRRQARLAMQSRLRAAADAGEGAERLLRSLVEAADAAGMGEETLLGQQLLAEVVERQAEAARLELRRRIGAAAGNEKLLAEVVQCADEAGHKAEADDARAALALATEAQRAQADARAQALEGVARAAATRDPEEIRAARDAAKQAGATQKEIGKAFAAGQNLVN